MNEIRPASAAEEWASALSSEEIAFRALGNALLHAANELAAGKRSNPSRRPAVAALALYGQPFGFTWDMVGAIQFLVMDFAGDPMRGMTEAEASAEWRRMKELAEAAADRIAALLPPRPPA